MSDGLAQEPPWPNGQRVGLLIRRLRVQVPHGGVSVVPVLYLWLRAGSAVHVLHDGHIYVWRLPQHVQRVFVGRQEQPATSWRKCAARPRVAQKYRAIDTLTVDLGSGSNSYVRWPCTGAPLA